MTGWRDRVVVITGASASVGRALTRDLVLVGWPTVKAVLGNSLVPWYVDRYVARFG